MALGFPEDSADVRIAQYETDTRKPRDEILVKMAKTLNVPLDILTEFYLNTKAEDTEQPLLINISRFLLSY